MEHFCSVCGQHHCQEHSLDAMPAGGKAAYSFSQPKSGESLGHEEGTPSGDGEEPAPSQPSKAQEGLAGLAIKMFAPQLVNPAVQISPDNTCHEACCAGDQDRGHEATLDPGTCLEACCAGDQAPLAELKLVPSPTTGRVACCEICDTTPLVTHTVSGSEDEESKEKAAKDKSTLNRLIIASILALGSEVTHFAGLPEWASIPLAALAVIIGGLSTWIEGWKSIRRFKLDILALMSVAVTGAVLIGQFSEAALVLVLFALAETLEDRSVDRARKAIASLLRLAPEKATIQGQDGSWAETKASDVPVGTIIRIRPGEKLALDGQVVSGNSAIDQSPITGESVPVEKSVGDKVFAGTLNVTGTLDYEVTVAYGDSALSRIVKVVEEAEGSRAPVERFVERFSKYYTPSVFVMAVIAGLLPPLAFGGGWLEWIYRALALLVISCPCALVVSTPVAILSALATATKAGLLVKGGIYLEEGRKLK
ncbi:MAG: HAD-IC family P-type ATPase, partial [Deltaproteobacteria bacterium]|nr:HAD-IC family P-type ATPase [Deltaproteobacteria bacterium]